MTIKESPDCSGSVPDAEVNPFSGFSYVHAGDGFRGQESQDDEE
jgi:hypothetical protein